MFYYIVSDTYKRMCAAYVTKEPCYKLNTCEPATQPENQYISKTSATSWGPALPRPHSPHKDHRFKFCAFFFFLLIS